MIFVLAAIARAGEASGVIKAAVVVGELKKVPVQQRLKTIKVKGVVIFVRFVKRYVGRAVLAYFVVVVAFLVYTVPHKEYINKDEIGNCIYHKSYSWSLSSKKPKILASSRCSSCDDDGFVVGCGGAGGDLRADGRRSFDLRRRAAVRSDRSACGSWPTVWLPETLVENLTEWALD